MLLVSGCFFLATHIFCLCYHPFHISFSEIIVISHTAQQAEFVNFLYFINCILTVIILSIIYLHQEQRFISGGRGSIKEGCNSGDMEVWQKKVSAAYERPAE